MKITQYFIPLDSLQGFSALLKSYISGSAGLKPLYSFPPTAQGFEELLAQQPFKYTDRSLVAEVISDQYERGEMYQSSKTKENISLLAHNNTYTVCTGHQLCVFTGPLYFIYKLISVINLAEELKRKHPSIHVVPIFWLASEDHDFEEVNHINLFGKKLSWSREEALGTIESMPAGKISTASMGSILAELKILLGASDTAQILYALFEKAYQTNKNLGEATSNLVNALLGEYGLVILDANDARLKTAFREVMKDELLHSTNLPLVQKGIDALAAVGYEAQVNPREINLFYLRDDLRGRIDKPSGSKLYNVLGAKLSFSEEDILEELKQYPERFSPNVVLRPLYQQILLPNLAYVGGPGELAYWLEYKAMFDYHKVVFPVLVPRNFVLWVDTASAAKIKKLNTTVENLSHNLSEIEKEYMQANLSEETRLDKEVLGLEEVYKRIITKASQTDLTLKASAEGEFQKAMNGLKNIESKMIRAEKQKHETSLTQIRNLKEKLYPGGVLQERVENFIPLYLKHGSLFISTLKEALDPLQYRMNLFTEGEVLAGTPVG